MKLGMVIAPLAALALFASACTPATRIAPPAGFAELEGQSAYDYRATSAQGVVLAVRAEPNAPRAPVEFWADAIDARLRHQGYAPAEALKDVRSDGGLAGKQLRYTHAQEDGRTYCYWVTLYVQNDKVFVVEAGGDKEAFDPARPAVERSVTALRGG